MCILAESSAFVTTLYAVPVRPRRNRFSAPIKANLEIFLAATRTSFGALQWIKAILIRRDLRVPPSIAPRIRRVMFLQSCRAKSKCRPNRYSSFSRFKYCILFSFLMQCAIWYVNVMRR